jgi:hypothetical protein
MTFKVDVEYHGPMTKGYKISIGTGKTFRAHSLKEVSNALRHYFNIDDHVKPCDECPLCRG